jgi:hypothetical protein
LLLIDLLLENVMDGSFSCVFSSNESLMPLVLGLEVALLDADAELTAFALEMAMELAAPACVSAELFAVASAFMPEAVVLLMLAVLPTLLWL